MLLGILNEGFQKSILTLDIFLFLGIMERDEKLKRPNINEKLDFISLIQNWRLLITTLLFWIMINIDCSNAAFDQLQHQCNREFLLYFTVPNAILTVIHPFVKWILIGLKIKNSESNIGVNAVKSERQSSQPLALTSTESSYWKDDPVSRNFQIECLEFLSLSA